MVDNGARLPTLRYRDGAAAKQFLAPITLMGRIVRVYAEVFRLEQARSRLTDLYIDDLAPALGGADMALGLMIDAADHDDRVKITLTKDRIIYDNPAQLQRFSEEAATSPLH